MKPLKYKIIIVTGFVAVLLIIPAVIFRVWTFGFWDARGRELFDFLSGYEPQQASERLCFDGDEGDIPLYVAVKNEEVNEFVLRKAESLAQAGKYHEALEELERAEEKNVWTFNLAMFKARVYSLLNEFGKAEAALDKALEMPQSHWIEAAPIQFDIYYAMCRYDAALDVALKGLEMEPRNLEFMIERNLVYLTYNQYDKAIAGIMEALEIKPGDPGLILNLAGAYWDKGDYDEGLKYALRAEKLLPDSGETHRVLSDLYVGLKQYDKAFDEIDKSVGIEGLTNSDNYIDRGRLFLQRNDIDSALKDALTAVRISPKKWTVYDFLGSVYHVKGEFDLALEAFNHGERYGAGDYDLYVIWMSRANLYLALKEYEKAIDDFTRVVNTNPDRWDAYAKRFEAYCSVGDVQAALADLLILENRFPEAAEYLPEYWKGLKNLANKIQNAEIERTAQEHIEKLSSQTPE